jgi:hypothetical protein
MNIFGHRKSSVLYMPCTWEKGREREGEREGGRKRGRGRERGREGRGGRGEVKFVEFYDCHAPSNMNHRVGFSVIDQIMASDQQQPPVLGATDTSQYYLDMSHMIRPFYQNQTTMQAVTNRMHFTSHTHHTQLICMPTFALLRIESFDGS